MSIFVRISVHGCAFPRMGGPLDSATERWLDASPWGHPVGSRAPVRVSVRTTRRNAVSRRSAGAGRQAAGSGWHRRVLAGVPTAFSGSAIEDLHQNDSPVLQSCLITLRAPNSASVFTRIVHARGARRLLSPPWCGIRMSGRTSTFQRHPFEAFVLTEIVILGDCLKRWNAARLGINGGRGNGVTRADRSGTYRSTANNSG